MIILGSGNMATNLAHAFTKAGVRIDCIYSRTLEHARELAEQVGVEQYTDSLEVVRSSLQKVTENQVVLYCLKDSVLGEVLEQIDAPEALHLHTAGSMGVEVFEGKNKPHAGVLYPFQTLSRQRVLDFTELPLFVEALDPKDLPEIESLAKQISHKVYPADSETRRRLHVAGVFANNFTNCMYAIASEVLRPTGLPEDVLLSLIDETAAKVHSMPARQAQTGPAKRSDNNVMNKHLELLADPELQEIYKLVSKNISEHA